MAGGGGPLTVYNAIRKPLLLHPRRRFIPPMLFPPTMSWSAFSSNRYFSSWKKQTFRFVSFRFGKPNFREASVPGEGEGGHHCARYYRPFIPNKWHSTFSSLSPFIPLFLSFSLVPFNRLRECGEQKGNGKSYLRGGGNLDSLRIEGGGRKEERGKIKKGFNSWIV